jgi:hypothetical protein
MQGFSSSHRGDTRKEARNLTLLELNANAARDAPLGTCSNPDPVTDNAANY